MIPTFAAGLASASLTAGVWQVARRIRELEVARQPPPELDPVGSPRGGRPLLSALYGHSGPSPVEELSAVAGSPWLLAGLGLAAIALATSLVGNRPTAAAVPTAPDSTVATLQRRVDSLSVRLTALGDSFRVAGTSAKALVRSQPSPTRIARRPAAPSDAILPAAPAPPTGYVP